MAEIATNRTSSSDYSGEFFLFRELLKISGFGQFLIFGFFLLFGLCF